MFDQIIVFECNALCANMSYFKTQGMVWFIYIVVLKKTYVYIKTT